MLLIILILFSINTLAYDQIIISHMGFHNIRTLERPGCDIKNRRKINAPPDFSLASYQKALDLGADFVEIDIQITKDNELVVLHDTDLSCYFGINKKVNELKFAEFKKIVNLGQNLSFDNGKTYPYRHNKISPYKLGDIINKLSPLKILFNPKVKDIKLIRKLEKLFTSFKDQQYIWGPYSIYKSLTNEKLTYIATPPFNFFCINEYRWLSFFSIFPPSCQIEGDISLMTKDVKTLFNWPYGTINDFKKYNKGIFLFIPNLDHEDKSLAQYKNTYLKGFIVSEIKRFMNLYKNW